MLRRTTGTRRSCPSSPCPWTGATPSCRTLTTLGERTQSTSAQSRASHPPTDRARSDTAVSSPSRTRPRPPPRILGLAALVAAGGCRDAPVCLHCQRRLHDGATVISERPAGFARFDAAARAALSGTTLAALPSATEGATSVRAFYICYYILRTSFSALWSCGDI